MTRAERFLGHVYRWSFAWLALVFTAGVLEACGQGATGPEQSEPAATAETARVPGDYGLEFDHALHAAQGMDCMDCHPYETMEGELLAYPEFPKHELCNMCHEIIGTGEDLSTCNVCHTRDDQLVDTRPRVLDARFNFTHPAHVDAAELECADCHSETGARPQPEGTFRGWCAKCHREMDTGIPADTLFN